MIVRLVAGPPGSVAMAEPSLNPLLADLIRRQLPYIAVALHDPGAPVLHDCANATEAYALKKRLGVAYLRIV